MLVAIQGCLDLATHWLADAGWEVPTSYAEVFTALARHDVIDSGLASRLAGAAGFRNLVTHQYGALDWRRVYVLASSDMTDLDIFCGDIARRAGGSA